MSASSITGTHSTARGTCWSITINNPTDEELKVYLPGGWRLEGQFEAGESGTRHFQGMLKTNQVRASAVKAVFPRAHIELAKNSKALQAYVHKDDTRIAEFDTVESTIPTLWDYERDIANRWEWSRYYEIVEAHADEKKFDYSDSALAYIDELVNEDIEAGQYGIEFISVNPMWRSAWKKHYRAIINRAEKHHKDASVHEAKNQGY